MSPSEKVVEAALIGGEGQQEEVTEGIPVWDQGEDQEEDPALLGLNNCKSVV